MKDSFSSRYGFCPEDTNPPIMDEAPKAFRAELYGILNNYFGLDSTKIKSIVLPMVGLFDEKYFSVSLEYPVETKEYIPNADYYFQTLKWYEIFDIIEGFYEYLSNLDRKDEFELRTNTLLKKSNIGWEMVDGLLEPRTDAATKELHLMAKSELEKIGFTSSAKELDEAIHDISRRPDPDITGAIHHAMNAIEAVAKKVFEEPKMTLGEVIKIHSDEFPKPLDQALGKLWGFACESGARHGKEGHELGYSDAFLVVGIASTICSYLINKQKG